MTSNDCAVVTLRLAVPITDDRHCVSWGVIRLKLGELMDCGLVEPRVLWRSEDDATWRHKLRLRQQKGRTALPGDGIGELRQRARGRSAIDGE